MKASNTPRILLCRAQGGLNDILSEIGRCLNYARKYGRLVVVETDYFDLNHFNDSFGKYFISSDPQLVLDSKKYRGQFDTMDCHPHFVQGRVNSYTCYPETVGIDKKTNLPVIVDFTRDHTEQLLVHHSNARQKARNAIQSLEVLHVQPAILEALEVRLKSIGEPYDAIHIRHTDYKTEYEGQVRHLKSRLAGSIFVATDNRDVLKACQSILDESKVFSFSHLPDDAGVPLHHLRGSENAEQRNLDAILDLFTLARAKEYYFFPRISKKFSLRHSYSGFSVLVDRLRHEPRLLHRALTGKLDLNLPNGSKLGSAIRQFLGR